MAAIIQETMNTEIANRQPEVSTAIEDALGHGRIRRTKSISSLLKHPMVQENLILVLIAAAYIAGLYCVYIIQGIPDRLVLLFHSTEFTRLAVLYTGGYFLYHIWAKSYRERLSPRLFIGFLTVFALLPLVKSAVASCKQAIPLIHPFSWDVALMRLDYVLHFGHHPWQLLAPLLSMPWIIRTLDYAYMAWFYLLFVSCLWMAWTPRRRLRLCYLVSTLFVWILIGSCLAIAFSSAGPCFYSKVVSTGNNPYAPLMQTLSNLSESSIKNGGSHLYATFNQDGLWEGAITGEWGPFGGISAMPSVHLSMATLFVWLAFEVRKWLGWVFVGYLALIQIGSVILGWHYAVDGYLGILLASMIWLCVRRFVYRR